MCRKTLYTLTFEPVGLLCSDSAVVYALHMFFRCLLTAVSLRPVWWQSWRTRWRWAAALWTARTLTPPSKTCQACPSAPLRAATWRWSQPCPESERTPRSARHRSTRPPYTEVQNSFDLCADEFDFFTIQKKYSEWSVLQEKDQVVSHMALTT